MGAIADNFVFIHMPKTAGTSLSKALCSCGAVKLSDYKGLDAFAKVRGRSAKHQPASHMRDFLGPDEWTRRFTFGIVRNPWDQLVSLYAFIGSNPNHPQHARVRAMRFAEFVPWFITDDQGRPQNRPDTWFDDENGEQLVTSIYRLEDIDAAFPEILERCGIAGRITLPFVNKSPREQYRSYYDDELAAYVAKLCASEIERFGYRF